MKVNNKTNIFNRLHRVNGQILGIEKMIQDDRYCMDVLHQLVATKAAISKVAMLVLEEHANNCLLEAIKANDEKKVLDELMEIFKALNK